MKRCPTCQKTFDDSMRFCQADGTPLVEDSEPVDPYKTMVARPGDIAAAIPPAESPEDDVLQLPDEQDSVKTMYASEKDIRQGSGDVEEQVIDIPPLSAVPSEPPKFSEPSLNPPSFGDTGGSPPSPFSSPSESTGGGRGQDEPFQSTTPPIPSPFSEPKTPSFEPEYKEPEPVFQQSAGNPFEQASMPEWAPPPVPVGQDRSFSPPPGAGGGAGKNQTLAIVSLVTGIISFLCCNWFIVGLAAVVMGFIAKGKAEKNPNEYGGRGLAMGGIITGALSAVIGLIFWILYFLGFMASLLGNMGNF